MSLKIVALNVHEDPEVTCATHTEFFRDCYCMAPTILTRCSVGKIVAHHDEASVLTATLKDFRAFRGSS